jgi:tetratricopeptide (TPR) repeat protein
VGHHQLGGISADEGYLDSSVQHYRRAIQLNEQAGDLYNGAKSRFNVAIVLLNADHRADALEYAEAALRGFESYGERAAEVIEKTRGLIAEIRGA